MEVLCIIFAHFDMRRVAYQAFRRSFENEKNSTRYPTLLKIINPYWNRAKQKFTLLNILTFCRDRVSFPQYKEASTVFKHSTEESENKQFSEARYTILRKLQLDSNSLNRKTNSNNLIWCVVFVYSRCGFRKSHPRTIHRIRRNRRIGSNLQRARLAFSSP